MSQKIQSPCYKLCCLFSLRWNPQSCSPQLWFTQKHPSWPPKMASGGYDNSGTLGRWCYDFAIQIYIYIWVLNDTFWFLWTSWNPFISKNLHNIKSTCIHRSLDIQIHYEHMLSIDFKGPTIFSGGVFVCLAYVTQLLLHPVLQWFVLCILQMQDVDEFQNSG